MRSVNNKWLGAWCITVLLALTCIGRQAFAAEGYESYFMYIGSDPHNESPGFLDGYEQFQGLAHDADNWFISAGEAMKGDHDPSEWKWGIWKIPLTSMGNNGLVNATPSHQILLSDLPTLRSEGYYHIGDIDQFRGFVLVPVENYHCCGDVTKGEERKGVAILFLNAADLSYVGKATIGAGSDDPNWPDFGWVAVNPADQKIYVSHDRTDSLEVYSVDWNWLDLVRHQTNLEVPLLHLPTIRLKDENGNLFSYVFHNVQGGAFSETGSLFYCVVGICDASYGSDGIHVFDTKTWQRLKQSTFCGEEVPPYACPSCPDFRFQWWEGIFDPINWEKTCALGSEPEGIDVWDLDSDPRSPYPGQLHVGRLYNVGGQDDVTIFHYTHALYADSSWTGDDQGKGYPYSTLGEANACAWDGAIIKMKPGYYNETLTLTKRVKLVGDGAGAVVIGVAGP